MLRKFLHSLILVALALEMGVFACAGNLHAQTGATSSGGELNSADFTFDLNAITNKNIKQADWKNQGVNYFFSRAIAIMAAVAGSVAVLMMTVGGFRMITSAGGDGFDKGKKMLINAGLGLVFVLGAYLLVVTIQLLIKSIYGG